MLKTLAIASLFIAACGTQTPGVSTPPPDAGPVPLATSCVTSADCNDALSCTTDLCVCLDPQCLQRECQRIPDDGRCEMASVCETGADVGEGGCKAPAPTCPASCDDAVACTVDSCGSDDLKCHHQPQSALCTGNQSCDAIRGCVDPSVCPTSCDDGYACTVDNCTPGFVCTHTKVDSACPSGQTCTATGAAGTGCSATTPTITCRVVPAGIEYTINGGLLDHLYPNGSTVASPTYLEYGDGYDGWVLPYPAGSTKQQLAYSGDFGAYVFTLNAGIDDLNFFLTDPADTDPSDGQTGGKYFDLAEWRLVNVTNAGGITSNCHLDAHGGGIQH
jgi:hypothetical protein